MPARKYEPGQYLNGILLISEAEKTHGNPHRKGVFQCPFCPNTFTIWFANVLDGNTKSCGCRQYKNRPVKHGHNRSQKLRSATYSTWATMIQRCTNPNYTKAHNYSERGIRVCDRWLVFENFLEDMGERPEGKTLDRYPNNETGIYEKSNCRWATPSQQRRNQRDTVMVDWYGERMALADWSEKFKMDHLKVYRRYKNGVSLSEILNGRSNFIPHSFGVIAA